MGLDPPQFRNGRSTVLPQTLPGAPAGFSAWEGAGRNTPVAALFPALCAFGGVCLCGSKRDTALLEARFEFDSFAFGKIREQRVSRETPR